MKASIISLATFGAVTLLSACGGGGGATGFGSFAADFAAIDNDPTLVSNTPDATLNARNSSANYSGVINIGTDAASDPDGASSFYGNLSMNVAFSNTSTNDAVTGTAGNFVQFFSETASAQTGNSVSGSLTMSGNLTGNNTSGNGDGLSGTATGTIDGISVAYDFDGNVTGLAGNGLSLFFDGTNADSSGGVGLAIQ